MVGDMADMDFEFSTEVVTLWPWQYHHYEPPGSVNHTQMYYCNGGNRCESCRGRVREPEMPSGNETAASGSREVPEESLDASNVCSKLMDTKCRVYGNEDCFICSAVTDQLVSIIRWIHDGDLLGSSKELREGEGQDYQSSSNCSSKNVSQSHTSFTSFSSDPDRGDNYLQSESRSQPWGVELSESASLSSGIEMETDVDAFGGGIVGQPVSRPSEEEKENSFRSNSGQFSYTEWYAAPQKSSANSSASAHTSLSLGMQSSSTQPYSHFGNEMYEKEEFVNPGNSEHYFIPPGRHTYVPVTTFVPGIPWNQGVIPQEGHEAFVNHMMEKKSNSFGGSRNEEWSSTRGSYGGNPKQEVGNQNVDAMRELTYLFNKDCSITNRKSSSAPAGSPAVISPRSYYQWQSHEFPPPCSTLASNSEIHFADHFPPPVTPFVVGNRITSDSSKTLTPLPFSSIVKSKPESQSRISVSPSVQQPKAEIRGKRSTKSSTRSSKTSSSSNNISPASSCPRKQAVAKATKGDTSAQKNSAPLVKQRPFLLRASFPPKPIPEGVPFKGGPLHMKYNFQPKSVTISALSKEEKAKNVMHKAKEEFLKEDKKSVEPEAMAVSGDPETANSQSEKRKSNDCNNVLGKKGKNKKAKGKKACPEKAKESRDVKSSKSTESQQKNVPDIVNHTTSASKRKHASAGGTAPSRPCPIKLRELNPDVRTPRSVRLRALHACRMNLNSTAGEKSDSDMSSGSTIELSLDESSFSFDEGVELSESKNKILKPDRDDSFHCVESRRVKKKKKKNIGETNGRTKEETRDMGCQTSKQ